MRKINGRYWVFKEDFGDARKPNGDFLEPLHPSDRRARGQLDGTATYRVTKIVNQSLLEKIGKEIWDFSSIVYGG